MLKISHYFILIFMCAISLSASEDEALRFKPEDLSPGEYVGDMRIAEIEQLGSGEHIIYNVRFSGYITIRGRYEYQEEDEFFFEEVFFYPDDESASRLPKIAGDHRIIWFSFTNYNEAKTLFGEPGASGEAVIIIDEYYIDSRRTETTNTAHLVELIELHEDQK